MSQARELANLRSIPTNGNILFDYTAGDALTSGGTCNIAAGLNALGASTTGDDNIAIGRLAIGTGVTTGTGNIGLGISALSAVTGGTNNIAMGLTAGDALTGGTDNIAIGRLAASATADGADNIAIGRSAFAVSAATADDNVAIGRSAMGASLVTGTNNIAIGTTSLDALLGGTDNIALGLNAGGGVTTGDFNIAIGNGAGVGVTTTDKTINIGCGVNTTAASTTCIGGGCVMATQFTATSDCRSKRDIKDLTFGLSFINLLRPVSYKWKPQADKLDKNGNLIEKGEGYHTGPRTMFGLLGQQVKEALVTLGLGYNDYSVFSDQEYENRNNPDWKKSYTMEDKTIQLTYDDFISPLIKSVQELSAEVNSLKAQLKTA